MRAFESKSNFTMDFTSNKFSSLLAWVNSFEVDKNINNLSQLSDGLVMLQCLRFLEFQPDDCINHSPLELIAIKLSDFYGCDLTKCGILEPAKIGAGQEEEIAKVLVLLLCMAVKHNENENFIEAIRLLPDNVQFDLKYFIETTLDQIDAGGFASGVFILDFDGAHKNVCTTPVYSLSNSKVHLITSPALQSWLCSPCSSDILTPKASNNQLFESLEVKELKHQLKMLEKELEIQRSLVMECEGEIELLSEEKNNLTVSLVQKETRICQLEDKCEELGHLDDVEVKLQKAEEEIKNLRRQLEQLREESNDRNELQKKMLNQDKELKELDQAKNMLQVKLLKCQHQVQELEFEGKSQQSQSVRNLKRYNEAIQKVESLERQISDQQKALTKEKEVLAKTSGQNALLQQENRTLNDELALFQEQYTTAMCSVGSKGQEIEQLQQVLKEMDEKHACELKAKQQQVEILKEQVTLLTARVEKLLAGNELQAKEFDEKETVLRGEWQEKISVHEAKSLSLLAQLSKAEEMVKSYQMMIDSLTRERDEGRLSAAEQLNSLEMACKARVQNLEQQILNSKQEVVQLKQCLLEQELQLKEMREGLEQKHEQLEHYHETTTLLEEKLASTQLDYTEAEEWHQKEIQQCSVELDKLKDEHKLTAMELSQQLEVVGNKHKVLTQENNELRKMVAEKGVEYADLQSMFNKQEKEYVNILQQFEKSTEEKEKLLFDSQQNQLVAKQQIEHLCDEKMKITAEYEAYHSVMQQKEIGLLHEVTELKQENGEQYQKELQQYLVELDKHKSKIVELSRQLEMATKEYEIINQQCTQQSEEFSKKIAEKELEFADLQSIFNKQEKEYMNILQQFEKLTEDKDKLLLDLKQTQLVAKQQVEQLNDEKEMMNKRLRKVHDEKAEMATEYQAYQITMQEKEVDLLYEVTKLKQEKSVALQKLEEGVGKLALMEGEHKELYVQLDNLNNTLQCVKSEHVVEIGSYQAAIDRGLSDNSQLEVKNNMLLQELSSVKQESLALAEKLQSCLDTEAKNTASWQLQVKQLEDDLCKVHKQLTSKELSIQQLSNDLFTSKQEHCSTLTLLELKKDELAQLETNHQMFRKNRATLLEDRENTIALLHSQMAKEKQQNKIELEVVHKENEELLKSVDKLYCCQAATNIQLEQDCQKKFSVLQQENDAKFEEIAKMHVEMTSLLNELKELKLNHKEVIDCLNVETEKNNLLENEAKQLKATIKAYEKENARLNKLMAQQKYGLRGSCEDEQVYIQQLHSEMASNHVIPLQPPAQETEDDSNRLEELRARNSLHPPHLKSCYPVELQLQCGTPKSSELQLKSATEKKTSYFEVSLPHKRNMAHRQQRQLDSPEYTKRRLSAPPTPTSQPSVTYKMQLRSYLNDEQENKPPSRASDAFEVSLSLDEQSRIKMEERKTKMFQRMAAARKSQQLVQRSTTTVTKPLRTRNAPKKK